MKLIGITCEIDDSEKRVADRVPHNYSDSIIKAGGIPVIIPMHRNEEVIKALVEKLDGVLLTGGKDVNPLIYNEQPHVLCKQTMMERDRYEALVLKYAHERKIPVLGICRGCQFINVYFGGSLYQDNSLCDSNTIDHNQKEAYHCPSHSINVREGSFLYDIFGEVGLVNSFHHQSIKRVAKGFKKIAISNDGIIEGIEGIRWPIVGLQFHPEMMHDADVKMQMIFDKWVKQL
ncbi:MAG: gamma-glutamyl-gamma-aminobutyrate hydrolase family protein [Firmicutes bacterium]|nr:gamma-glutamyl-gamma-aminobutyrate hydrolase family protein [Bacillota bacterium]